jgi:hypothetical protein
MDDPQSVLLPQDGQHTLADLTPALLTAQGVPGLADRLAVPATRTVCLLLIDGLGWRLLREHADRAPFLSEALGDSAPLTAGFPATTATSVASIGTGLAAGRHGIVGYTFEVPGQPLLNTLRWSTQLGDRRDLREQLVPEQVQPERTLFERAKADGVAVTMAAPLIHRGSGLTRAVLRGARFTPCHALGDLVTTAADALNAAGRVFCYAYHGDLDVLGHSYGPGSAPWREQLGFIDRMVAAIASALPEDGVLAVAADHGMVRMAGADRIEIKDHPELSVGVRLLGGEARVPARLRRTRRGAGCVGALAIRARRACAGPQQGRGDRGRLVRPDRRRARPAPDRRRGRGHARQRRRRPRGAGDARGEHGRPARLADGGRTAGTADPDGDLTH